MFVSKLQLKNFKRFTDLTIDLSGLRPAPRLVLMIGVNGSGKSCVFDAFEWLSLADKNAKRPIDETYYKKSPTMPLWGEMVDAKGRKLQGNDGVFTGDFGTQTAFYGRSAFRQIPELTVTSLTGGFNLEEDSDRPRRYIEPDNRFENDVATMVRRLVREVLGFRFDPQELLDQYITPINLALARIFGDSSAIALSLHSMLPPLQTQPVEMRFRKGVSDINYDLLSSGEKEIINILFNLHNRRAFYQDTIYFIDELDVHLNTSLQYNLLKEITENWLPEKCQLWTASHSLGFIQYAQESAHAAILDFDQFDFDVPHTLTPRIK
ncbi:MAG: AAA family ATPase, partial [Blastocatellia bacterium]